MVALGRRSRAAVTETMTQSIEGPLVESAEAAQRPAYTGTSIVVPAFNEEDGIEGVVRRLAGLTLGQGEVEILVVDDGSTDGTGALLQKLATEIEALEAMPGSNPGDPVDRIALERAIADLPDGARTVLLLHDIHGYRHDEIAQMTSTRPGTSKAHLHRARKLLREALSR